MMNQKYSRLGTPGHTFCHCVIDQGQGEGPQTMMCVKKTLNSPCVKNMRKRIDEAFASE